MMDVKQKFNLITNHLMLEKEKKHLELERFINDDDVNINTVCELTSKRLQEYRESINNLDTWMELIEPINNKPEEKKRVNKN